MSLHPPTCNKAQTIQCYEVITTISTGARMVPVGGGNSNNRYWFAIRTHMNQDQWILEHCGNCRVMLLLLIMLAAISIQRVLTNIQIYHFNSKSRLSSTILFDLSVIIIKEF